MATTTTRLNLSKPESTDRVKDEQAALASALEAIDDNVMIYKGTYSEIVTYHAYDIVSSGLSMFMSTATQTGVEPPGTDWLLLGGASTDILYIGDKGASGDPWHSANDGGRIRLADQSTDQPNSFFTMYSGSQQWTDTGGQYEEHYGGIGWNADQYDPSEISCGWVWESKYREGEDDPLQVEIHLVFTAAEISPGVRGPSVRVLSSNVKHESGIPHTILRGSFQWQGSGNGGTEMSLRGDWPDDGDFSLLNHEAFTIASSNSPYDTGASMFQVYVAGGFPSMKLGALGGTKSGMIQFDHRVGDGLLDIYADNVGIAVPSTGKYLLTTYNDVLAPIAGGNVQLLDWTGFGGGHGVVSLHDADVAPTTAPSNGVVFFSEDGILKWIDGSATVHSLEQFFDQKGHYPPGEGEAIPEALVLWRANLADTDIGFYGAQLGGGTFTDGVNTDWDYTWSIGLNAGEAATPGKAVAEWVIETNYRNPDGDLCLECYWQFVSEDNQQIRPIGFGPIPVDGSHGLPGVTIAGGLTLYDHEANAFVNFMYDKNAGNLLRLKADPGDDPLGTSLALEAAAGTDVLLEMSNGSMHLYIGSSGVTVPYIQGAGPQAAIWFDKSVSFSYRQAQDATDGFLYIPTIADAPTGVPTTQNPFGLGPLAPIVFDPTNNKLWVYNDDTNAWKEFSSGDFTPFTGDLYGQGRFSNGLIVGTDGTNGGESAIGAGPAQDLWLAYNHGTGVVNFAGGSSSIVASVAADGAFTSAKGIGMWGHAAPTSQPALPTDLAGVIAILVGQGACAAS